MRERRKRKTVGECRNEKRAIEDVESANQHQFIQPSKKRKLPGESLPTSTSSSVKSISDTASSNDDVIVLPADLTAKQAKKFRKDARRKARAAGQDDSKLEFVIQGQVSTKQTRKKEPDQQQRKNKRSEKLRRGGRRNKVIVYIGIVGGCRIEERRRRRKKKKEEKK